MAASYDFTVDWNRLPVGSQFTTIEQHVVFNDDATPPDPGVCPAPGNSANLGGPYNGDTGASKYFKIVADPRDATKRVLQYFYPKGSFGAVGGWTGGAAYGAGSFGVGFLASDVINMEWSVLFMPGFDFTSPLDTGTVNVGSQGKIAPMIRNDVDSLRIMWNYSNQRRLCHFLIYSANEATGHHYNEVSLPWDIAAGQWYKLRMQFAGGPAGWTKVWINDVLVFDFGPTPLSSVANNWLYAGSSFFGGQSPQAARNDSYMLESPVHVWTGLTMPVPVPVPPPAPGKMSVTVSIVVRDAIGNIVPATVTVA